jgi:Tfp pilus assembly protein PilE
MIHLTFLARARGFTLLVAVIFTSVVLTVALALSAIAYRQVILASTAQQSQKAFYAADSALECALYQDQKNDLFNYANAGQVTFSCEAQSITFTPGSPIIAAPYNSRISTFNILCPGASGIQASVSVQKFSNASTTLDASGFSSCNSSDPNLVERGVKASYPGT